MTESRRSRHSRSDDDFAKYRQMAPHTMEDDKLRSLMKMHKNNQAAILTAIQNIWQDTPDQHAIGEEWVSTSKDKKIATKVTSNGAKSGRGNDRKDGKVGRGKGGDREPRGERSSSPRVEKSDRKKYPTRPSTEAKSTEDTQVEISQIDEKPAVKPVVRAAPMSAWGKPAPSAVAVAEPVAVAPVVAEVPFSSSGGGWGSGVSLAERLKRAETEKATEKVRAEKKQKEVKKVEAEKPEQDASSEGIGKGLRNKERSRRGRGKKNGEETDEGELPSSSTDMAVGSTSIVADTAVSSEPLVTKEATKSPWADSVPSSDSSSDAFKFGGFGTALDSSSTLEVAAQANKTATTNAWGNTKGSQKPSEPAPVDKGPWSTNNVADSSTMGSLFTQEKSIGASAAPTSSAPPGLQSATTSTKPQSQGNTSNGRAPRGSQQQQQPNQQEQQAYQPQLPPGIPATMKQSSGDLAPSLQPTSNASPYMGGNAYPPMSTGPFDSLSQPQFMPQPGYGRGFNVVGGGLSNTSQTLPTTATTTTTNTVASSSNVHAQTAGASTSISNTATTANGQQQQQQVRQQQQQVQQQQQYPPNAAQFPFYGNPYYGQQAFFYGQQVPNYYGQGRGMYQQPHQRGPYGPDPYGNNGSIYPADVYNQAGAQFADANTYGNMNNQSNLSTVGGSTSRQGNRQGGSNNNNNSNNNSNSNSGNNNNGNNNANNNNNNQAMQGVTPVAQNMQDLSNYGYVNHQAQAQWQFQQHNQAAASGWGAPMMGFPPSASSPLLGQTLAFSQPMGVGNASTSKAGIQGNGGNHQRGGNNNNSNSSSSNNNNNNSNNYNFGQGRGSGSSMF